MGASKRRKIRPHLLLLPQRSQSLLLQQHTPQLLNRLKDLSLNTNLPTEQEQEQEYLLHQLHKESNSLKASF